MKGLYVSWQHSVKLPSIQHLQLCYMEGMSSSGISTCQTSLCPRVGIGSSNHLGFEITVKYFCSKPKSMALFSRSKQSSGGKFSGHCDVSPMSISPIFKQQIMHYLLQNKMYVTSDFQGDYPNFSTRVKSCEIK